MSDPRAFIDRASYRRKRRRDAAYLLPVAGVFAFASPVLLVFAGRTIGGAPGVAVWLFGVWALLILAAALLSSRLG